MNPEKLKHPNPEDFKKLDEKYEEGKEGLDEIGVSKQDYQRAYIEVGELAEKGNVRFWDSSKSFQNSEIQTMDLDEVPEVSEEELNAARAEGKALLEKLDAVFRNSYLDMSPEKFAETMQKENLSEILKEYARVYRRNTGLMLKNIKGYTPYLSPRIDLFLRAAEVLGK